MIPRARQAGLVIEEFQSELIVYDLDREEIHCLNPIAAAVWRHCNGQTSSTQLLEIVRREVDPGATEDVIWLGLDHLEKSHLLDKPIDDSLDRTRRSRRQIIQEVGVAAGSALLVPLVTSIVAPIPAFAQSVPCTPQDQPCGLDAPDAPPCCPGLGCTDCGKGRGNFRCRATCP